MSSSSWQQRFSTLAHRVSPPQISWLMAQALEVPGLISLAAGFVDRGTLPHEALLKETTDLLANPETGAAALQYGTTQGDAGLREAISTALHAEGVLPQGVEPNPGALIMGAGSQQVLYLLCEALLDEGDIILLEAPTYFVVLGAFAARGAQTIGLDTDEHGLKPEALEQCLEQLEQAGKLGRVKMLYGMTYGANPTGVSWSQQRMDAVWNILQKYHNKGCPILFMEDAAYRRLSFSDNLPAPMKARDTVNEMVLYSESFSKTFSPGMRLGFGYGPVELIKKMVDIKGNHDFGTSNFCQQIMKRAMQSGLFEKQVETLRSTYLKKWEMVEEILQSQFPAEASWYTPSGGFYTWVTLPESWDTGPESDVFQQALEQKVLYVPGALCYSKDRAEAHHNSSIRLAFGLPNAEELHEGCARLGKALQTVAETH